MPLPPGWSASAAITTRSTMPWRGHVWRDHARRFSATSPDGSLIFSGRYNRGRDSLLPAHEIWSALYFALAPEIALEEVSRHLVSGVPKQVQDLLARNPAMPPEELGETAHVLLSGLNARLLSEISVELSDVLDCRDVEAMGLKPPDVEPADLFHDTDFTVGQELGAAIVARGHEAMLIPSATRLGDNLIVFPTNLQPRSRIQFVGSRSPSSYVDRR